ncbi:hypothetical protein TUA1478L_03870 [Lactiplantibacillus plantarum]
MVEKVNRNTKIPNKASNAGVTAAKFKITALPPPNSCGQINPIGITSKNGTKPSNQLGNRNLAYQFGIVSVTF